MGVCMFATPCSENVRSAPFGPAEKHRVTELHRLVLLDECPRNSESHFISRALKILLEKKPGIRCVLSFADPSAGHAGTIYQATNFIYTGQSSPATFYLDADGRLRHPRQNGHNVTKAEAVAWGWTPTKRAGKHRYAMIVGPTHAERRKWRGALRYEPLPYPKQVSR